MSSSNSFQALSTLEQVIDHNFVIVTPNMPVAEAIALMSQQQSSLALVVEQQQLLGIFTERDVVRVMVSTTVLEQIAIAQVMTCPLITLAVTQAQNIFQVLSILRQQQTSNLPIVDDWGQVIGVVTTQKLGEFFIDMSASVQTVPQVALLPGELSQPQQAQHLLGQEALQKAREELEPRVEQRTAELSKANALLRQEISDRKMVEEALRLSEERFRNLVETSSDWVWEVNENAVYTYASPKIRDLLGYEPEQIVGKTPFELMPPEEANRVAEIFTHLAVSQLPFQCLENIHIHKNGHFVVLETSGIPVFDRDGKFRGYRGIDRDITERKQAGKELKHTQIFLNSLLKNLPVAVFAKDAQELRFVFWNEFSTHLMGYSASEAIGKSDYDLFPHEQAEFCTAQDREVLATGKIVANLEEVVHTAHLGQRIFRVTKAPIFDEVGRAQYVMGIVEDITEHKQAEAAKRDAENKTILLQEIHHRVKNNLQIVSGLLYLQSRLVEDEQTLQMLQDSRNRLQAMGLIHEKLYNSKNLDSIDFRDYIKSLTQILFTSYANNTAAITLTLNIAPLFLDIDTAIPCGLIVNELVSNALKYAFFGQKTGEITVEFHGHGGNNFDLTVRDNGIGMAEDISCNTQNSLGMRLVYSLVTQQLEGTLKLERNKGTTFRIRFPK